MENTIDIRNYILSDSIETNEVKKKAKKPADVKFETIFASGTDFIIQKTTPKTCNSLVCIVSQKQYYIKNERTGELLSLTPELLNKFVAGNVVTIDGISWIGGLESGLEFAREFSDFLELDGYLKENILFFKKGATRGVWAIRNAKETINKYSHIIKRIRSEFDDVNINIFSDALFSHSRYSSDESSDESRVVYLINNLCSLDLIYEHYGISGLDLFLKEYHEAADIIKCLGYRFEALIEQNNFKCKAFIDYLIHESLRQGYAHSSFISTWLDTINMQKTIYGRVKEKYPENLSSLHQKLSYISIVRKRAYNEERWKEAVEKALPLEHKNQFYAVTVPKTRDELIDEATQQSNCVAGYFEKMVNGACTILFLRKIKEPDKSYITVEVRNGEIVQAKMFHNRSLTSEASRMLEQYADVKGLKKAW